MVTLSVLCPLVINLREFEKDSSDLEVWLKEREAELEECGTIGANLDRCIEQTSILEVGGAIFKGGVYYIIPGWTGHYSKGWVGLYSREGCGYNNLPSSKWMECC